MICKNLFIYNIVRGGGVNVSEFSSFSVDQGYILYKLLLEKLKINQQGKKRGKLNQKWV